MRRERCKHVSLLADCAAQASAQAQGSACAPAATCPAGRAAEKAILQRERGITALYTAYGSARAGLADAEDQLDLMSNTLGSTVDDVQRQLAAAGHLRAEIGRREAAAAAARDRMEATRHRLQLEGQQLGSLQQRVGMPCTMGTHKGGSSRTGQAVLPLIQPLIGVWGSMRSTCPSPSGPLGLCPMW